MSENILFFLPLVDFVRLWQMSTSHPRRQFICPFPLHYTPSCYEDMRVNTNKIKVKLMKIFNLQNMFIDPFSFVCDFCAGVCMFMCLCVCACMHGTFVIYKRKFSMYINTKNILNILIYHAKLSFNIIIYYFTYKEIEHSLVMA